MKNDRTIKAATEPRGTKTLRITGAIQCGLRNLPNGNSVWGRRLAFGAEIAKPADVLWDSVLRGKAKRSRWISVRLCIALPVKKNRRKTAGSFGLISLL